MQSRPAPHPIFLFPVFMSKDLRAAAAGSILVFDNVIKRRGAGVLQGWSVGFLWQMPGALSWVRKLAGVGRPLAFPISYRSHALMLSNQGVVVDHKTLKAIRWQVT